MTLEGVNRIIKKRLLNIGIKDFSDLSRFSPEELLGKGISQTFITEYASMLKQNSTNGVITLTGINCRSTPIPGQPGCSEHYLDVRAIDLPSNLADYSEVNPRSASKNKIYTAIKQTLLEHPKDFIIKNAGLILAAQTVKSNGNTLELHLSDPINNGLVDGGHSNVAILDARKIAAEKRIDISDAYVRIHAYQGLDRKQALAIATGQNTRKPVQKFSIMNQEGCFEDIKRAVANITGASQIRYFENGPGAVDVRTVIQIINAFNGERYSKKKPPASEYGRVRKSLDNYYEDWKKRPSPTKLVIQILPQLLMLHDCITAAVPLNWNKLDKKYGSIIIGQKKASEGKTKLHFLGKEIKYSTCAGLTYPILTAFRANIRWNLANGAICWKKPIKLVFDKTISDLVEQFQDIYYAVHSNASSKFNATSKDMPSTYTCLYNIVDEFVRQ